MNTTPLTRMCLVLIVAFLLADSAYAKNASPRLVDKTTEDRTTTGITDENAAAKIPIQLDPTHIFLELKVNGKGPFSFALDTGASYSAVSSRTAKEVGLATFGNFSAGGVGENERKAQMARGVDFELPGVSNYDLAQWCRNNLEFDQLILEFYNSGDPYSGWPDLAVLRTAPGHGELETQYRRHRGRRERPHRH